MLSLLAAAGLTCVIVVPTDQVPGSFSPRVTYEHELAHCSGWKHGGDGRNMRNVIPPRSFVHKPSMKLKVWRAPAEEVREICRRNGGDAYGCQWFE